MSLRVRIGLLFLGFSVLPVVFLGVGDYVQSVQALGAVLEARSDALAEQTAREVESAHGRGQAVLMSVARVSDPAGGADAAGESGPFLRVRSMARSAGVADGTALPAGGCAGPGGTVPVRLELPGSRGGIEERAPRVVEGTLPIETLLAWAPSLRSRLGKEGFTQLLDRDTGALLFDSRCVSDGDAADPGSIGPIPAVTTAAVRLGARPGTGAWHTSFEYDDGPAHRVAAVSTAGTAWAVAIHTTDREFVAPFREARVYYLGLVLLVMVVAAGAFMLLAQGAFRSLDAVTAAADRVDLGDLRPWLPPPGDDEVGRLSLAFRTMTERLEESARRAELHQKLAAVGELATYLSHEIRNPLSSIRLSLQSLHRDLASGFIPPDSTRVIEIALNEVKRLDGVVRAVLEMGRPVGSTPGRTCTVHRTLDETLDVLRPKLRAQGIELVYAPRAVRDEVVAEAEGLRSVVINLVVNAIDALEGRPDARLRISTWSGAAGADEAGGGELHIRIADNGPGIPADVTGSIFEPFFTTKTRGNGIGLPTALRTVQPWGGSIVHEPVAAGSGAVFVVKLRLAAATPVTEPAPAATLTQTLPT